MIELNISYSQANDSFKIIKEWAPIVISLFTLFLTTIIARAARLAQKQINYRDIQKMFGDFYNVGISDNKLVSRSIADIVNPSKMLEYNNIPDGTDIERIFIIKYLVILEAAYLNSNVSITRKLLRKILKKDIRKNHAERMIESEIKKLRNLPGFNSAMEQYFDEKFKLFINSNSRSDK
jgi:hypothetical protein